MVCLTLKRLFFFFSSCAAVASGQVNYVEICESCLKSRPCAEAYALEGPAWCVPENIASFRANYERGAAIAMEYSQSVLDATMHAAMLPSCADRNEHYSAVENHCVCKTNVCRAFLISSFPLLVSLVVFSTAAYIFVSTLYLAKKKQQQQHMKL